MRNVVLCVSLLLAGCVMLPLGGGREIHVAVNGDDSGTGSMRSPLKTIQAAANLAKPGDTVTVHAGVYREMVVPPLGGVSDSKRIVFRAAPGEKVTISGSEKARGWVPVSNDTWKLTLPNSVFGQFNPFAEKVFGDWFDARGRVHHRGTVYLNGVWHHEAVTLDEVMKPAGKRLCWFAQVGGAGNSASGDKPGTVIYAQFPGIDPNTSDVEISMRPAVIKPAKTNVDYLTIRGFDLRNASPNWAAPTSGQEGLVTAYWCKGWIIEDNEISYSRCCGIALAKYSDEWDNRRGSTEGYYGTIEDAIKKAGWSRDRIGGHIVRNNNIHHCEQTGIVGSLGCAFSLIENNEIHDIHTQGIWEGAEMAGIKFHGAIDVVIRNNHIHHCGNFGGIWLDWMAQGVQVTGNFLHDNVGYAGDLFCEVDHGPYLVANNIFLSRDTNLSNSRGAAFVHNLIAGSMRVVPDGRQTPYFKPHSTEMVGMWDAPVGDARFYNNIFAGRANLGTYNGATLPVVAGGNVFTKGAAVSRFDTNALIKADFDPAIQVEQKPDGWYLTLTLDKTWRDEAARQIVDSQKLGKAVIPDQVFGNPDGSPLRIDTDYSGRSRNTASPFPGPFEKVVGGLQTIKVWPRP